MAYRAEQQRPSLPGPSFPASLERWPKPPGGSPISAWNARAGAYAVRSMLASHPGSEKRTGWSAAAARQAPLRAGPRFHTNRATVWGGNRLRSSHPVISANAEESLARRQPFRTCAIAPANPFPAFPRSGRGSTEDCLRARDPSAAPLDEGVGRRQKDSKRWTDYSR